MTEQLHELAQSWLTILASELVFVPLLAGISLGLLISLTPFVQAKKRMSDRSFYVYSANGVGSGSCFLLINQDALITAMSMLIFVVAASIIAPYAWFSYWKNKQ